MTRRKINIDKWQTDLPKVSKFRIGLGIGLGILNSFSFYCLLHITREIIRFFTISETYELWVLTDNEIQFYNLFTAYLSIFIGQSVAFLFIFNLPRFRLGNNSIKKRMIINDQRNLLWYFLAWSSKVTLVYFATVVLTLRDYDNVSFYPEFNYLFILIIIVLFLHSWHSTRSLFPSRSLKWMLTSFVIVTILATGLSKVKMVDTDAFNQRVLSKNLRFKHDINIPIIDNSLITNLGYKTLAKVHIAKDHSMISTTDYHLYFNHFEVNHEEFDNLLNTLSEKAPRSHKYSPIMLYIDSDIQLSILNRLKELFRKNNFYILAYNVRPLKDTHFHSDFGFKVRLPGFLEFDKEEEKAFESNSSSIMISNNGNFFVERNKVHPDSLAQAIKEQIHLTSKTNFTFRYEESISFEKYIKVLTSYQLAINKLRDELAMENYQKTYNYLDRPERDIIKRQFPHVLYETPILIKEANSIISKISQ